MKTATTKPRRDVVYALKKRWFLLFILGAIVILLAFITIETYTGAIEYGAGAAKTAYLESRDESEEKSREEAYAASFETAEESWHLINDVKIQLGDLTEISKLEVLQVSDVEYVTTDGGHTKSTSWLMVPGTGVFTVDLKASEFLFDNNRKYVLVRIPRPELTSYGIDSENVQQLFFKEGLFESSVGAGVNLAIEQRKTADELIKTAFLSNENYYRSAENAARKLIVNLVKQFNLDIPDLVVEIEIMT